jgi:hypothetical protein
MVAVVRELEIDRGPSSLSRLHQLLHAAMKGVLQQPLEGGDRSSRLGLRLSPIGRARPILLDLGDDLLELG